MLALDTDRPGVTQRDACCRFCQEGHPRPVETGKEWPSALASRLRALHADLKVHLKRDGESGYVEVLQLVIPADRRRRGLGTQIMSGICWHADQNGDVLVGTPEPIHAGKPALTGPQLRRWYRRRFGFVPNRGRRLDLDTRHTLRRSPAP
ncbi:GNAT family N-acetyltransferase [Actinomadura rudentiformis]|uniref:GNAT family N-acetyltransferase n=1 Tax=Actinomadura rudentiformis TaxID=359158 RepID=A0A6H9YNI8_9ACTN|nr:GNAT family N-acetyltransferase [Actinomadura rudentiformis]KAB2344915.1 hypothetical protein F8566_30465 [Actinomadura rudentiformis]